MAASDVCFAAVHRQTNEIEYLAGWRIEAAGSALRDCSLIVPTYKRPMEIAALMEHLLTHSCDDVPGEVVVVDGSPNDETEKEMQRWSATRALPFRLQYVRSKPGLTRQKNVGVDISCGQYLFFLDDDTRTQPGYFRELRTVFATDTAGEIGAAGGAITNEMGKRPTFRWRVRLALRLVPLAGPMHYDASAISLPKSLAQPFTGVKTVDIVPGGACCFRREVFHKHRFSSFFEGYSNGEDVEMSLRTGREFKVLWCGSARLTHHPAPGGRPPGFTRGRMDLRNRLFIRRRFFPNAPFRASIRFWADALLLIALDLILYGRHPRNTFLLRHAAGLLFASFEGFLSPPTATEPPACRRYALAEILSESLRKQ
ncbi:MAG TPA: glycosyltransferase [Bryobacteraceae bacterium]